MGAALKAYKSPEVPSNLFRVQTRVLRFCGVELVKDETYWYKIYAYIWVFIWGFAFSLLQVYELYAARHDEIDVLFSIIMHSMSHVNGSIKCCTLFLIRKKFKRMTKLLQEGFCKPDVNRGGEEELLHVRACLKKNENMFIIFASCILVVYMAFVADMVNMFIFKPREEWKMPILPITIIDVTYSPMFELALIYQNVSVTFAATFILATDILLVSIVSNLSCQFKLLKAAFKNARNRAVALKESSHGKDKSFEECFEIVVHDSVKHHLLILDLAAEMESLCNIMLLFAFIINAIQLCFMLFEASLVSIESIIFVKSMVYWVDVLFQLFIYCYSADEVTTESVKVIDGVMEMDWPGAPISVQKSMVLVMVRGLRPVRITAGKFINISLDMFMRIVKTSVSYFMVLRQLNEQA